ncbi:MAG: NTP transferase domain-containing protein [Elusimicrobia bacterium]|nr:NTP transferase domain-containing protein [Elusimicrobiota bacterium]
MISLAEIDAVILCGGLGTRLCASLRGLPKPLAPIGERSFLEILISRAVSRGLRRFILCVGHKAEMIENSVRSGPGREIIFSREPAPLGTAGALKLCEPLRHSRTSLVMNGDSFCDFDPAALLEAHAASGGPATIAVVSAAGRTDGGFVELAKTGEIARFSEKSGTARHINAGIYALNSEVWPYIPAERPCSLEKEVFPSLLKRGLRGWIAPAELFDIGTPERLDAFRKTFNLKDNF